ncbi:hypothetical protein [Nannocystis punicea]|uniref:Nitroreductase n=1 Tax=Nannocystis punicea TaxID=2995304 RepID=A0ABY7H645_9BACT|nr:hypothetical protein [Nannocystis poenicansa]WAS94746.1 hypothetical protein O0S08_01180 [Nannocystis poenicansa]
MQPPDLDRHADPWTLAGSAPAPEAGPRARIELALHTALTAPSPGNCQPWRWFAGGEVIELYRDPARTCGASDPDGQAATLACGAALGALRVALRALGLDEQTALLPGGHPDLLARVAVGGRASPLPEEQWLYQAAPKRRTYRGVMAHGPLSRALSRRLGVMVDGTGAEYHVVEDMTRKQAIAAAVEAAIAGEPPARAAARAAGGEPGVSFEGPDGAEARGPAIADGAPAFVVVTTAGDDHAEWLRAGQALMRVLLRARVDHAWGSFLHLPLADAAGRKQLATLMGATGHAQALVRLGGGADSLPTPRRPLSDVLLAQRPN